MVNSTYSIPSRDIIELFVLSFDFTWRYKWITYGGWKPHHTHQRLKFEVCSTKQIYYIQINTELDFSIVKGKQQALDFRLQKCGGA